MKKIDGKLVDTDCPYYSADICSEVGCDNCSLYDNPVPDDEDDIVEEHIEAFEYEDEDLDDEDFDEDDEDFDEDEYDDELDNYDDDEEDDSDFFEGEFFVDEDCPNFSESCLAVGCRDCTLYEGDSDFEDDNFGA